MTSTITRRKRANMPDEPEVKLSEDGQGVWIGDKRLRLEQAEAKAHEILGIIEYVRIWGNRNDRRSK